PPAPHSFPTRRSSDLRTVGVFDFDQAQLRIIRPVRAVKHARVADGATFPTEPPRRAQLVEHVRPSGLSDEGPRYERCARAGRSGDRKSTRLNSSHLGI